MTTPANDSTSYGPGPRPVGEPSFPRAQQTRAANGWTSSAGQARDFARHQADQPVTPPSPRNGGGTVNKTGGGFKPAASVAFNKTTIINGGGGTGGQAPAGPGTGGKVPGSDFMGNEDIRAFCEYHRKQSRNGATELAMDADHLEAVLRTIPDADGRLNGSRARARRVSRWLKKAAAADKAKQKYFAALYATFEREYESELRKIGKGRTQPKANRPFGWR